MAGATGKAAAQVTTRSRMYGREGAWTAAFFVLADTQSTALAPSGAQRETTMATWIATTSLKDFARRDFLLSSALTAVLFAAAMLLFPANHETEAKVLQMSPQVSAR